MPSPLRQALDNLTERIDEDLLPLLVRRASMSTAEIREQFDEQGVPRVGGPRPPVSADELERAAERLIRDAGRRALVRGALAGAAGLFAVPPEAVAALIQALHLGQRIAVLYGHDPETDSGKLLLTRAMAGAFGLQMPEQGPVKPRLREIPALLKAGASGPPTVVNARALVSTVAVRTAVSVASRLSRAIPGLGAGLSAVTARRSLAEQGVLIHASFRQRYVGEAYATVDAGHVEDALELP